MRVRVVAGKYGGRFISTPSGQKTHPMGERVKSAMFNTLGAKVSGAKVLDAFAGSGALGIEAMSRGASHVTFLEKDRKAQATIKQNLENLNLIENSKLIKTTVSNWLATSEEGELYDIIFADPPYHDPQFSTVKKLMGLLKSDGLMVLSYSGIGEVLFETDFVVVDDRSYGNARLIYIRPAMGRGESPGR